MSPPSPGIAQIKGIPSRLSRTPTTFLLIGFSLVLQLVLWRTLERLKGYGRSGVESLGRRGDFHSAFDDDDNDNNTLLGIPYEDLYNATPPAARPFAFFALCLWAAFLFATIGISASDFFCPNLATVADRLGMGESTAGVTFLAFGNGSPDVFSTFSALKSSTFSLAIGELIGASCFIISIVVGCMALTNPFHVPRWPFLRDVGFFTLAVVILVACLGDGHLSVWESGGMVILYVIYVAIVVGGNWWNTKRAARRELIASQTAGAAADQTVEQTEWLEDDAAEDDAIEVNGDQPQLNLDLLTAPSTPSRNRSRSGTVSSITSLNTLRKATDSAPSRPTIRPRKSSVNSRTSPYLTPTSARALPDAPRPTFSLLGAIEFRDVVNSLRRESGAGGPSGFSDMISPMADLIDETPGAAGYFGPTTPFGMGHYHPHHFVGTPGHSGLGHNRGASLQVGGGDFTTGRSARSRSVSQTPGSRSRHSRHHSTAVSPRDLVGLGLSRATSLPGVPKLKKQQSRSQDDVRRASVGGSIAEGTEPVGSEESSIVAQPEEPAMSRELAEEVNPWEGVVGAKKVRPTVQIPGKAPEESTPGNAGRSLRLPSINISVVDLEDQSRLVVSEEHQEYPEFTHHRIRKRDRLRAIVHSTLHLLFPSMHEFSHKSVIGKVLAVFAVPAIFCLTLTLPVVDDVAEGCTINRGGIALSESESEVDGESGKLAPNIAVDLSQGNRYRDNPEEEGTRIVTGQAGHQLHHLVDHGGVYSPSSSPRAHHLQRRAHLFESSTDFQSESPIGEDDANGSGDTTRVNNLDDDASEIDSSEQEDVLDEMNFLFNKYLTAAQCVFGPLFCSYVLFSGQDWGNWVIFGTVGAGTIVAGVTLWRAEDGQNPVWRMIRCFFGFFSAIMWISAIADEVVTILGVFGKILGWSNAIIGLTIFAVGNSLADLVANLTVASFAPSMAYAACYGGPMLNILLGVGGAGTYVILSTGARYPVQFSPTLWVSSFGLVFLLVATLLFVPYNGYYISRQWGIFLICVYVAVTITNVLVEIRHGR